MDAAHWPQEIGLLKPVSCSSSSYSSPSPSPSSSSMAELIMVPPPPPPSSIASSTIARTPQLIERRTRPSKEQALHCPRCSSTNTKFCYYNNYSLTQPRYFCKTCRRYWTEGGSLRNVPVGGGSRKNKKSTTTTTATAAPPPPPPSSSSANVKKLPGLPPDELNPNFQEVKDYSLSFYGNDSMSNNPFAPPPQEAAAGSVLYPSGAGLGLPSFLSSAVNQPMNATTMQEGGGSDGRLILPFQDFTQVHPAFEQDRGQGSNASSGLWNGVMGGGPHW